MPSVVKTYNPCNCMAGVIATGGIPPYSFIVIPPSGTTNVAGNMACVTGLCPGTYTISVLDMNAGSAEIIVTVGQSCCTLNCSDTSFCYNTPDSIIKLKKPSYADTTGGGTQGGAGGPVGCQYDSIWNNTPGVYPTGTTVVTSYVIHNGVLDSCTQNVIRNPPSSYQIKFGTFPPIVAGVINICNGQSITFTDSSVGTTGRHWNFGNGYYSGNAIHTEPGWQEFSKNCSLIFYCHFLLPLSGLIAVRGKQLLGDHANSESSWLCIPQKQTLIYSLINIKKVKDYISSRPVKI